MTELREPVPPPPPPAPVPAGWEGILESGETLTWSAQRSISVMLAPLLWMIAGAVAGMVICAANAPRTLSVEAFCNESQSSRCAKDFFILWPSALFFAGAAVVLLAKFPAIAKGEGQLFYAVTPLRAIKFELGKPNSVGEVALNGATVKLSFFGNLRVVKSKYEQVVFPGLTEKEIAEATLAATQGGAEKWP